MIIYWTIFVVVGSLLWFLFYKELLYRSLYPSDLNSIWITKSEGRFMKRYMNKFYWKYTKKKYKRFKEEFLHPPWGK